MMLRKWMFLLLMLLFSTWLASCGSDDSDSDDDNDVSSDADADSDSDTDTSGDTEAWPEDIRGEPCEKGDPDPEKYNYGDNYAKGPYGFKGSICWNEAGEYSWGGGGDTLHNFCLPNQDGEEVCLGDYYRSVYDLLIIIFSTQW